MSNSLKGKGEHITFIAIRETVEKESNVHLAAHTPTQVKWYCFLFERARCAHLRRLCDSESGPVGGEIGHQTLLLTQLFLASFSYDGYLT